MSKDEQPREFQRTCLPGALQRLLYTAIA